MRITRLISVTIPATPAGRQAAFVDLHEQLASLHPDRPAEIWVTLVDYPRLCAVVDQSRRGWLMLLRDEQDEGLHSINPAYDGPPDARAPFRLSNGQLELYPEAWCYAAADVLAVVEHFARESAVPDWIQWQAD
jgi:hypothetical protein